MPFRSLFSIMLSIIVLQSCSSGNNKPKDPVAGVKDTVAVVKEKFPTGQVIDNVVSRTNPSQSYALYLPANYSSDKKYPLVVALDAHGTGKLPVSLYKDLAEKYGYIIVGSNNSKNGNSWEESNSIVINLFTDAQARLSVNSARINLLGFSGGARIANGMAITNGIVEGVICCGASNPAINSKTPRNNYYFMGIAGTRDFNYTEMARYDMIELAGHNVKHTLVTFDGKHEWPPQDIMDEAFWWMELNEMRKNPAIKNDSLIAKKYTPVLKQLEFLQQKKQFYDIYKLCLKTVNFYTGVADVSKFIDAYQLLRDSPEVDKQLKKQTKIWGEEETIKQFYVKSLQTQNLEWWKNNIASLNQKIKAERDKDLVNMNKRVLDYLSLAAYMQASGLLTQHNLEASDFFCKLYVIVDPTNKEAYYLTASVNALKGNSNEAISSLNTAVKNGFDDVARLQSDSTFTSIKGTKAFEEIIGKIRTN